MTVHTNLPERILNAQTEAVKEENVKAENLGRLIKPIFETRSDGIQCFEGLRLNTKSHPVYYNNLKSQSGSGRKYTMEFVSGLRRTPSGYDNILEITARSDGNPSGYEHCLPPGNRWSK
ncbi:hypothetical protein Tco_0207398 [Tanacetum coccineum]